MANFLIRLPVAVLVIFIWEFVVTLIMRLFGVRLPFQLFGKNRKRALQLLTFSQSVWEGVLVSGCGAFIGTSLVEYFLCKYGNAPWTDFSLRIRFYAVSCPALGLLAGVVRGSENRTRIAAGPPGTEKRDRFGFVLPTSPCATDSPENATSPRTK